MITQGEEVAETALPWADPDHPDIDYSLDVLRAGA